jgi:uncharacterized membrane protein
MNLDLLALGWVHFAASLIAVAVGAFVLVRPKGTAVHRLRGRIYAAAIIVTSLTGFGIYRNGIFYYPHWFGVAALVVVAIGIVAARYRLPRRGWMHLHLTCMVGSYYILIGGGVNEVFLRVDALRRLAPRISDSPLVAMTHFAVVVLFAALIAYFNVALVLRRSRPAQ